MVRSESNLDEVSEEDSCLFDIDVDEIFEQNIDDFDEAMDKEYDDGIAHSELEDSYDEDLTDDHIIEAEFDDGHSPPFEHTDEFDDYDELEE